MHGLLPDVAAWQLRSPPPLGHRLDHDRAVTPSGDDRCELRLPAEGHRHLARLVERVVGRLSTSGRRRRTERLAVLAEGRQRVRRPQAPDALRAR